VVDAKLECEMDARGEERKFAEEGCSEGYLMKCGPAFLLSAYEFLAHPAGNICGREWEKRIRPG
jgi:hypothetical protein